MTDTQAKLVAQHAELLGYQAFDPDSDGGSYGRRYHDEAHTWIRRIGVDQLIAEIGIDLSWVEIEEEWCKCFQYGWENALEDTSGNVGRGGMR